MTWEEWKKKENGRFEAALCGENPTVIMRMESGFAVLGDSQLLPGYSLLLAYPIVSSLNDLELQQRLAFLRDMALLGQAVEEVCGAIRVNYGIYGNTDPFLHAHVWARYAYETEERRKYPVWFYPREELYAPEVMFDPAKHDALRLKLAARLQELQEDYT